MTSDATEAARERQRLALERQARAAAASERAAARARELSRRAEIIAGSTSRRRRLLGAVLGSRAWDALLSAVRSTPHRRRRRTDDEPLTADAALAGRRRELARAERRLDAYEGGLAKARGALARTLRPRPEAGRRKLAPASGEARVVREREPGPWRIAVRIADLDLEAAARGGDLHLARGIAGALAARGHSAVVRSAVDPAPAGCDAMIALRGRGPIPPQAGTLNLLWIVSHPDDVDAAELEAYDRVLVASEAHAGSLIPATRGPVDVLLQFAHDDFIDSGAPPDRRHRLLFVGNWRNHYRRIVWDAHCAGWRPALVGDGWRHIAPTETISEHVAYHELPDLYRSTEILLADHWDDMRERGFVANRVFDALACETFVVADRVAGLAELLPGGIVTYGSPTELDRTIRDHLANPAARQRIAARGRELVVAGHTAAHRAEQLESVLRHHLSAVATRG